MIKNIITKIRNKNYIKITDVSTKNKKLIIKYETRGKADQFFEKNKFMEIDYDFNLDYISKSILVIPFFITFFTSSVDYKE